MSDYVTLLGSEQVQNAGCNMRAAAEDMQRASNQFDDTATRLICKMDEFMERIEAAVIRAEEAINGGETTSDQA